MEATAYYIRIEATTYVGGHLYILWRLGIFTLEATTYVKSFFVTFCVIYTIHSSTYYKIWNSYINIIRNAFLINDRVVRHDFWQRLWLFFYPFLFPPKKRGKKKGRMNRKNCDQKSWLSARNKQSCKNINLCA